MRHLCLAGYVLILGCGNTTSTSDPAPSSAPAALDRSAPADTCARWEVVYADHDARCGIDGEARHARAECETDLATTGTDLTPALVNECLDAIEASRICDIRAAEAPCQRARGALENDVECTDSRQCKSGYCQEGRCADRREDGASCRSTLECREGSYCGSTSESSGTWCIAYLPVGAECFSGGMSISAACGPGLACSARQNGRCVPVVPVGAACDANAKCDSAAACVDGICR